MSENIFLSKQKGFTLMELMIVIAILGIVASIASPMYSDFIRRSQVRAAARDFQSALESAKHHARTSGRQMTVCATADVNAAVPQCQQTYDGFNTSANNTNMGWVVFRDANGDNIASGAGENVIKRVAFNRSKVRVVSNGRAIIRIAPRNRTGDTGTVCIYSPRGNESLDSCSANGDFHTEMFEMRVTLSALGKATIRQ